MCTTTGNTNRIAELNPLIRYITAGAFAVLATVFIISMGAL